VGDGEVIGEGEDNRESSYAPIIAPIVMTANNADIHILLMPDFENKRNTSKNHSQLLNDS
jgi:hypothetical protein